MLFEVEGQLIHARSFKSNLKTNINNACGANAGKLLLDKRIAGMFRISSSQ
jgi:hypothetical protein